MPKKKPLRWRREPDMSGLASIGQCPRGAELRCDGEVIVHVSAWRLPTSWGRDYRGWYWVAVSDRFGVPLKNTAGGEPISEDIEVVKAEAMAYVKEHIRYPESE